MKNTIKPMKAKIFIISNKKINRRLIKMLLNKMPKKMLKKVNFELIIIPHYLSILIFLRV